MTDPSRMSLAGVLQGVGLRGELAREWWELTVAGLEYDSRQVEKDTLFFAFQGARVDGRQFAREAVARGACAVVSELPPAEDIAALAGSSALRIAQRGPGPSSGIKSRRLAAA